jgi:hypothetical protein
VGSISAAEDGELNGHFWYLRWELLLAEEVISSTSLWSHVWGPSGLKGPDFLLREVWESNWQNWCDFSDAIVDLANIVGRAVSINGVDKVGYNSAWFVEASDSVDSGLWASHDEELRWD